jgi:hypothetical protein
MLELKLKWMIRWSKCNVLFMWKLFFFFSFLSSWWVRYLSFSHLFFRNRRESSLYSSDSRVINQYLNHIMTLWPISWWKSVYITMYFKAIHVPLCRLRDNNGKTIIAYFEMYSRFCYQYYKIFLSLQLINIIQGCRLYSVECINIILVIFLFDFYSIFYSIFYLTSSSSYLF